MRLNVFGDSISMSKQFAPLQDCISNIQVPMVDGEGSLVFKSWPIVLPHVLAEQLIKGGFRHVLGYATQEYWRAKSGAHGFDMPKGEAIGLQLYGDEAQFFENEQWMALHWQSENSPYWENARLSRFVISLLPVSSYYIHQGVNMTLDSVLAQVVKSLNHWRNNGVQQVFCQLSTLKGDWKFLCQALLLKRKPDKNEICFWCSGTRNLQCPVTDRSATAKWRCEIPGEPWFRVPSLLNLEGFNLTMVGIDLLHCFFLGVGRDLISSTLVIMLRSGVFPGRCASCLQAHSLLVCDLASVVFVAHQGS